MPVFPPQTTMFVFIKWSCGIKFLILLRNSVQTKKVSEYLDSAYVEEKDDSLNWCFDLNVPLVTTRVVMKTHNESGNYVIDSITTGKIDSYALLINNSLLTNEMLDTLFNNASLPIKSHLESKQLTITLTNFLPLFNTNEVSSYFISTLTPYISPLTTGIGFRASLDAVKAIPPLDTLATYNIPELLFNKMSLGLNSGTLLEVNSLDASSYFLEGFGFPKEIENLKGNISMGVKTARVNFDNNVFNLDFYLYINDFVMKLRSTLNVSTTGSSTFNLVLGVNPTADGLEAYLVNEFFTKFKNKHSNYVTTRLDAKVITIDFTTEILSLDTTHSLDPDIYLYNYNTSILNNKLTFTIESLID